MVILLDRLKKKGKNRVVLIDSPLSGVLNCGNRLVL